MSKIKPLRIFLLLLGGVFTVNAIAYAFLAYVNIGFAATLMLGLIFLLSGIFWRAFLRLPQWIRGVYYGLICLMLAAICFIAVFGACDTATYKEDAVIVLGAGIKGDKIPDGLALRLDKTVQYHKRNPDAVIILSGGQGEGEDLPESIAMKEYLLACGVAEESIITEELSTNTYENFKYSKQILSERLGESTNAVLITNGYHVLRSSIIAEGAGISASHVGADTPWILFIPSLLRECVGLARLWILGY